MRYFVALVLLATWPLSSQFACAGDWTPPENPDLQGILNEAREDTEAGDYADALAKYLWFHENALSINPAMSGVRLSFALNGWRDLGKEYPPALDKMKSLRKELEQRARAGEDLKNGFQDLAELNRVLGDDSRTARVFQKMDELNPQVSKSSFLYFRSALIRAKAYELCGKYIEPKRDFLRLKQAYERHQQLAADNKFGPQYTQFGMKNFRNQSSTLVAILVINKRSDEAIEIADQARRVLDDKDFHKEIDAALEGLVPDPWP